jgi:hypothetical protein
MYISLRDLTSDPKLAEERSLISVFSIVTGSDFTLATAGYYRIPTFESRTKVIRAMLIEWKDKRYDASAIQEQIEKLSSLSLTRNNWVHGFWCMGGDPKREVVIFDYRNPAGHRNRRRPVKEADVWNHIRAVHGRSEKINELTRKPSPGTDA